jgi:predicted component of type VI protein secretion system
VSENGPLRLNAAAADFAARFDAFVKAPRGAEADVGAAVAPVIADIRAQGMDALVDVHKALRQMGCDARRPARLEG